MKPIKAIFTAVMLTFLVFTAVGCNDKSKPVPIQDDIYTPAMQALQQSDSLSMEMTTNKILTVGSENIKEKHKKQVTLQNIHSDAMIGQITGSVEFGDFQLQTEEIFHSNNLFLTLDGAAFSGESTREDFLSRMPPVNLIDPKLYGSVTAVYSKNEIVLSFTEPTAAESWAVPEDSTVVNAAAAAVLSSEGSLQSASYEVTYSCSTFQYQLKASITYSNQASTPIQLPESTLYTPLEDVYAPYYLEQTYGYLQQAKHLQAQLTENIFSEVDPLYYDRQITLDRSGNDATVQTHVKLTDYSRGGQVSSYIQTETFRDGSYSIVQDGKQSDDVSRIDSQDMNLYCTKLLTSNILAPAYVTGATVEIQDNILNFTYTAGEALGEKVCQKSCETIYQNPAFLDSVAQSYDDYRAEYYLTVDLTSGLPLSSGLKFSGSHSIEGIDYVLTTCYEQAYIFLVQ